MSRPSNEGSDVLARAERSARALRKQTVGTTVAVLLFGMASAGALLILGLASGAGRVIGASTLGAFAALALVVVIANSKARARDFTRRYLITIGVWALFYTFFVVGGLTVFAPAPPWFWVLGAVLVAAPELWFAYGSRSPKSVQQ